MPVTVTNGALTLTGDGTDIWNNADDFVFAYKTLTGDGSIIARVVSVGTGTNTWAKGGVMIRGDLTVGSTFVNMVMTGSSGNGASFQYRLTAAGACANTDAAAALPVPYWVKLTRTGSVIAGYVSADGKTWTQQGTSQTITMANPVDIGLCVCAHQAGEYRAMQFDNIATTGNVSSSWQGVQINSSPHNDPAGLYVVVTDNAGKSKVEVNADPAATNAANWTQWTIPLSDLTAAGVKTAKIQKITVGVGDKTNPKTGGAGTVFIDDIGYGHPIK
jgi:regulation of enolase protein 1 (concanavalin A-like superfamily)